MKAPALWCTENQLFGMPKDRGFLRAAITLRVTVHPSVNCYHYGAFPLPNRP